jgi:cell wall assembly regulator SMI1
MNNINELIIGIWQDIKEWYKIHAPQRLEDLMDGISKTEIIELEQKIGFSLPEDYKASLKIHNGDCHISDYNYLSGDSVIYQWLMMKELLEEGKFSDFKINYPEKNIIQNTWWDLKWIPFAEDSGGNMICIDMNPGINGIEGQIIYMEINEGPIPSKYKSFLDWLESYKNDLYDNLYEVDEEGYISPK